MTAAPVTGDRRLRTAGIGVVIAGLLLAAGVLVLEFVIVSTLLVAAGIGVAVSGERTDVVQLGVGVLAVGGIGLVEALGYGLGLEPFALAGIAVAFGLFDVLASVGLGKLRDRY